MGTPLSIRVDISEENLFTVKALKELSEKRQPKKRSHTACALFCLYVLFEQIARCNRATNHKNKILPCQIADQDSSCVGLGIVTLKSLKIRKRRHYLDGQDKRAPNEASRV